MKRAGVIELTVRAGLGNRMREIASGLALARAADKRLKVFWLNNKNLNCPYERLFEPIEGVRIVSIESNRRRALRSPRSLLYRVRKKLRLKPFDLFLGNVEIGRYKDEGIDLASVVSQTRRCGIETFMRFYGSVACYDDLKAKEEILEEADRAISGVEQDKLIGVHIRRGDNEAAIQVSPVEAFIERMQEEISQDPGAIFFLSTDDPETEQAVKDSFPGKVLTRPKVFARNQTEGVRDALVDLLVLSKCRLILGSYWSSFSDAASELSGARRETVRIRADGSGADG
jgi:hypothetical protein